MKHEFEFVDSPSSEDGHKGFYIRIPKNIVSEEELMEAYARRANLPDYFGKNWDALDEVLRDFSWIREEIILIVHEDLPMKNNYSALSIYLNILLSSIRDWKEGDPHTIRVIFPTSTRSAVRSLLN